MKLIILSATTILAVGLVACTSQGNSNSQTQEVESAKSTTENMKSMISIFEIPATEFSRAVKFYQSILGIEISEIDMQGTQMGLFPSDGQAVSGVIIKGEGYNPSSDGVIIYLNGGDNLQPTLDRVEINGGQVIVPKTLIDAENGYFALFLDTEGNRIGLHSPN
ncbi:MAG: VOC family protein [Cyclobacteriaceae bacterium]